MFFFQFLFWVVISIPVIGNSWEVNFSLISASVCSQMTFIFFFLAFYGIFGKLWYLAKVLKHAESFGCIKLWNSFTSIYRISLVEINTVGNSFIPVHLVLRSTFKYLMLTCIVTSEGTSSNNFLKSNANKMTCTDLE